MIDHGCKYFPSKVMIPFIMVIEKFSCKLKVNRMRYNHVTGAIHLTSRAPACMRLSALLPSPAYILLPPPSNLVF